MAQAFPDMVARQKWKQSERNLQVGDIGHIKYNNDKGSPTWRMARIQEIKVDDDGRVRTITVAFRPRNVTDKGKDYASKTPKTLEIGVQRFAVLLAKEEQGTPVQDGGQLVTSA